MARITVKGVSEIRGPLIVIENVSGIRMGEYLEVKLKGTNGDIATVAIAVNAIRRVKEALPGLVTMPDIPIVTLW